MNNGAEAASMLPTMKVRSLILLRQPFPGEGPNLLRRSSSEGQHLPSALGAFQEISPVLHHPCTRF